MTSLSRKKKIGVMIVALLLLSLVWLMWTEYINLSDLGSSFLSSNDKKIDPAITEAFSKGSSTVPVIVRMNLPSDKFYDLKDSTETRTKKNNEFSNAKIRVEKVIGKGKIKHDLKIINGFSANVVSSDLTSLSKSALVERIDIDREVTAFLDTSLTDINAPYAWNLASPVTGQGKIIAIIDTGVDYTHPDLGGCLGSGCKVIDGYDFINGDADPMDDHGHGTHVAATAAGKGVSTDSSHTKLYGVAPDANILAYKVLNASGSGSFSGVIAAINRTVDPDGDSNPVDHADVANLSLGAGCGAAYNLSCGPDDPTSTAIDNAVAAGVVFVVAAGNSGPSSNTVGSPATSRSAISVAAACKSSDVGGSARCTSPIASFSSRGPVLWDGVDFEKPDISAPGVSICAAQWGDAFSSSPSCFDNGHVRISGTSMATPHMAGVVALLRQAKPSYSPAQIKTLLKGTARSLGSGLTYNDQGMGEVDVEAAIETNEGVTITPARMDFTPEVAKDVDSVTKSFSVPSNGAFGVLNISVASLGQGITIATDKQSIDLSGGVTGTFKITITVDSKLVQTGFTNTVLYLRDSLDKVAGWVPIAVYVPPEAPLVTITYPSDNQSFSSIATSYVDVSTVVSDNRKVDRVEYYVTSDYHDWKGIPFAIDTTSPFVGRFNLVAPGTGHDSERHTLTAKVFDEDENMAESSVRIQVENVPPIVDIYYPTGGEVFTDNLYIQANAMDTTGLQRFISKIEFYKDSDSIPFATDTTSPFGVSAVDFSKWSNGSHVIKAKAYDAVGNTAVDSVTITTKYSAPDTISPKVSLIKPSNGEIISGITTFAASASDNLGVTKVVFYRNSDYTKSENILGTDTTSPYSISLDTTKFTDEYLNGVAAAAYDAKGNVGVSSPRITVGIDNTPDTTAPTVSITKPKSGDTVSGVLTMSASATDNIKVTKVEFYIDGEINPRVVDTEKPYSVSTDTFSLVDGSHTLKAKAYDSTGNIGTAQISIVTSNATVDREPPVLSIVSPPNGTGVDSTVEIRVRASDNVGIGSFVGGGFIPTSEPDEYIKTVDFGGYMNGPYDYTIAVYDTSGNYTSVQITVNVQHPIE